MTDGDNERQTAIETMNAWRQARDACKPGSKEYEEFDREYRKAVPNRFIRLTIRPPSSRS